MRASAKWAFQRGLLWTAELSTIQPCPVTTRLPIQIRPVDIHEAHPLLAAAGEIDPIASGALIKRIEQGCRCYAAWYGESIIAYSWLTHGPEWVNEFERELNVEDGEAYIWDCATLPTYRRQRVFSALLCYAVEQLRREGLKRVWIISRTTGLKLASAFSVAGFNPVVHLSYLRLLSWQGLLISSCTGASARHLADAQRLLTSKRDIAFGSWWISNGKHKSPPDTHLLNFYDAPH